MNKILEELSDIGIVPVVKIDDAKDALPLAKALMDGGLPCAEVTFRTDAAEETIRKMCRAYPEMLVGAGTVLTTGQADKAVAAGAKFLVSPGLNPEVVKHCISQGYPIVPGVTSPTEIEAAISLGITTLKFFPAEAAGGIEMIEALSAPYGNITFMPTGGVNAENLKTYLDFPKVLACGGSWMVPSDIISTGNFEEITRLTKETVLKMLGFELGHIGINESSEDKAKSTADAFSTLFGFLQKDGKSSVFAGSGIEVMKSPYLGEKGHIAIRTNYIKRAIRYLSSQGVEFLEDSKKLGDNGSLAAIYLKEQTGGFALHLVQK